MKAKKPRSNRTVKRAVQAIEPTPAMATELPSEGGAEEAATEDLVARPRTRMRTRTGKSAKLAVGKGRGAKLKVARAGSKAAGKHRVSRRRKTTAAAPDL